MSNNNEREDPANPPVPIVPAEEWFQQGRRVLYDPARRRIVKQETPTTVRVWERSVAPCGVSGSRTRWLTLLPGPPVGSYSYAKVDGLLQTSPRLYVEFVGQGDSDKPNNYPHTVIDRANLVEAHWRAHKIRRTVLVCMGCSTSMTMMELLNRQTERLSLGLPLKTRIEHVLCINGGYFADGHRPHPLNKCPIVKNTIGKVAAKAAQHSNIVLDPILRKCVSKDYDLTRQELSEFETVVRKYNGMNYFTSRAMNYIDEHKKNSRRWDLHNVYNMTRRQAVSFTVLGGEQDRFESKSFAMAKERMGGYVDVYFESIAGGHQPATERPRRVAQMIDAVATAPAYCNEEDACFSSSKRASMAHSDADTSTTVSSSNHSTSSLWDAEYPEDFEFPF